MAKNPRASDFLNYHASESPVKTQIAGLHPGNSDSADLEWGLEQAFVTSSQVMLVLLVRRPHVNNYCLRESETAQFLAFSNRRK